MNEKTILYAWEIGDGYGHLQNLVAAARKRPECAARFAVPASATHAAAYLAERGFDDVVYLQPAPPIDWSKYPHVAQPYRARDFADVLAAYGYDTVDRLDGIVAQATNALVGIEDVITDTAPTFNMLGNGVTDVGSTWSMPPADCAMTLFLGAPEGAPPIVPEDDMLDLITHVTGIGGNYLATRIAAHRQEPSSYPILDVYGLGRGAGPSRPMSAMPLPTTPARFAYLHRGYPALAGLLGCLAESSVPVRAHVKGDVTEGTYGSLTLIGAFDLAEELACATEVIHHGSAGLAASVLGTGRKQGCLPWHVENLCQAHALCRTGAWMLGYDDLADLREYLQAPIEITAIPSANNVRAD